MSKISLFNAMAVVAISTGVMSFIFKDIKAIDSLMVFIGFSLASINYLIKLYNDKITSSTVYLLGMGLMLQLSWVNIPENMMMAWIGGLLWMLYTIGFILTVRTSKNQMLEDQTT